MDEGALLELLIGMLVGSTKVVVGDTELLEGMTDGPPVLGRDDVAVGTGATVGPLVAAGRNEVGATVGGAVLVVGATEGALVGGTKEVGPEVDEAVEAVVGATDGRAVGGSEDVGSAVGPKPVGAFEGVDVGLNKYAPVVALWLHALGLGW